MSDGTLGASKGLDHGIRPRKYETDMAILGPLNEVRRRSINSMDLQDLRVTIVLTFMVGLDYQFVSDTGVHGYLPLTTFTVPRDVHTSPGPMVLI